MSDQDQNNEEPPSIFDPEPPEEGAIVSNAPEVPPVVPEGPDKTVTDDGHLKVKVPTGDIDPFDHSAEDDLIRAKKSEDGVAPPELPTTEEASVSNPPMMVDPTEGLQLEMERRFQQEFGDLKVEVTQEEREAFVRAALHDSELAFNIKLDGVGAVVKIALPTDEFTNSAASAVSHWGEEGHIDKGSDMQWLLAFQQIHAWGQVRAVNGAPTSWADFWEGEELTVADIRKGMRNHALFSDIQSMGAARWRMLLEAIRTAELKYKICMQNWRDKSFFSGADTD